jgi:DNA-binding HxlR family transcriptional regulator
MQPVSPDPIVQAITGYMTAKYLFVASEMGLFEALASGTHTLDSLSRKTNIPARTLRMVLDALAATGFLQRQGDAYQNTPVTATYLSGQPGMDLRPRLRLWDKVVYAQWATLEKAIRTGKRTYGLPEFSGQEHEAFNIGVSHLTAPSAKALAGQYDFGQHHSILDLAGGLGYFLIAALEQHPAVKGTLFELPATAKAAKARLAANPAVAERITITEGDVIADELPTSHDAVILANIIHLFSPQTNSQLLGRIRGCVGAGARLLLVDFWTNDLHTEPVFAALMAAEFQIYSGEGDVYSVSEVEGWLTGNGWRLLEHQPLAGPASLVIAEAV